MSHDARNGATSPALDNENARLQRRVRQQELSLRLMSDAIIDLRRGSIALRQENRELHAELAAARDARRALSA